MVSKTPKRRTVRPGPKVGTRKRNPRHATPAKQRRANAGAKTKLEALIAALSGPKGASLAQLMALTGWQMHSVRGAMSGALKKQRGLSIVSTKTGAERVYRIESRK